MLYPGSGVVLDCIVSSSLPSFLLPFKIIKLQSSVNWRCYEQILVRFELETCTSFFNHLSKEEGKIRNRFNQMPHLTQDTI